MSSSARAADPGVAIGDVIDEFLLSLRISNARPDTINWYASRLTGFWTDLDQPLSQALSAATIRQRIGELLDSGLKSSTVAGYLRAIKRIINWGHIEDQWSEISAVDVRRFPRVRVDESPKRVLSPDEIARLLKAPDLRTYVGKRDRAIIALFADSGMRVGELTRILREDVSLAPPTIILHGESTKSRKTRTVPMSEPMVCIMRSWLRARDRRAGDDPYLFPSQQGGPLERHSINHSLHRYARRVGVATPLGPHAFRRSFATASLRDGASMVSVQQTLGHATLHMTRRYAAMIDTDGYQAVTAHSPLVTMARKVTG